MASDVAETKPASAPLFEWTRPVPEDWVRDLESVVPQSDRVSWLKLWWFAGWPYEPVNRWVLYECSPKLEFVPDGVLDSLQGPNPREIGKWQADPAVPGKKRWITESLVSYNQWAIYRDTHCYPSLWWVIQGTQGGHKWKLSLDEQAFLGASGIEARDTPAPGALPYAPWDERVKAQVVRADRLRRWRETLGWDDRQTDKHHAAAFVRRERAGLRRLYNAELLKWLDAQVSDVISDLPRGIASDLVAEAPRGGDDYNADEDALVEQILNE